MSFGPIFIGGLAFSGKTQMRLMLSSHPNIVMTRRTYMWTRFYNRYGDLGHSDNFERCLTALMQQKHVRILEPDPDRIRREFWQDAPTYARLFGLFHEHYAERLGKPRWGDQLGMVERFAAPIFSAFPTAKMIHMIRDPRARIEESATRSRHRPGKLGWATARWLHSVRLMKQNQQKYLDRYKIVHYETLVSQPEETLREVCAFLGEDFVPTMITMENAIRFGNKSDGTDEVSDIRATAAVLGRTPLKAVSVREIAFTQSQTKRDMLALGYRLEPAPLTFRDRLLYYSVDWPVNWMSMVVWDTFKTRQLAQLFKGVSQ